jgi:hypothetical protein
VLSDLPFAAVVGVSLVWLDRCSRSSRKESGLTATGLRPLVGLGLLVALAVSIRREGVAFLLAVAAVQVFDLAARRDDVGIRPLRLRLSRQIWLRLAAPYAAFLVALVALQLALPVPLKSTYGGSGFGNVTGHASFYTDAFAEAIGLKQAGVPLAVLGSSSLGDWLVTIVLALAATGVVARLIADPRRDLPLATYGIVAAVIVLVQPFQEGRYLYTIAPIVAYFAWQAIPTLIASTTTRSVLMRVAVVVVAAGAAALVTQNVRAVAHATDYHTTYRYTVEGPATKQAQQMFAAVRQHTGPDDVVAFFRARAMSLYTGREALQLTVLAQIEQRADWYVMVKDSTYSQYLVTAQDETTAHLARVWENSEYVLWKVTTPR